MVLLDFSEPLSVATDSEYIKVILHIETTELTPDDSELISVFLIVLF